MEVHDCLGGCERTSRSWIDPWKECMQASFRAMRFRQREDAEVKSNDGWVWLVCFREMSVPPLHKLRWPFAVKIRMEVGQKPKVWKLPRSEEAWAHCNSTDRREGSSKSFESSSSYRMRTIFIWGPCSRTSCLWGSTASSSHCPSEDG